MKKPKKLKLGLAKKPATRYPNTKGCFNFLNTNTAIAAVTNINPKSFINSGKWMVVVVNRDKIIGSKLFFKNKK